MSVLSSGHQENADFILSEMAGLSELSIQCNLLSRGTDERMASYQGTLSQNGVPLPHVNEPALKGTCQMGTVPLKYLCAP